MSELVLVPRHSRGPVGRGVRQPIVHPELASDGVLAQAARALQVGDLLLVGAGLVATRSLAASVLSVAGFRLAAVLGALLNEWAHVAVALLHGAGGRSFHQRNLTGHRPLRVHALACLPFAPDRRG